MILVGYATAHGSTRGVAEAIAARLEQAGLDLELKSLADVSGLAAYHAFVLGSAVQNQKWLPVAVDFATRRAAELVGKPLWLFSVSSLGETSSFFGPRTASVVRRLRGDREVPELVTLLQSLRARGHRHFAGAIEASHWSRLGNAFLKLLGGHYGDHRDWRDIEQWADAIANELREASH